MTDATSQTSQALGRQAGWRTKSATLAGVLLAFASVSMALSGTAVAVPAIARDLGGSGFALNWVVTGYFLTASALMLVAGTLADIVGRRRVFAIGAGCFGAGALGSALAADIVVLDLSRTVSGVGSACLMAAGGAIVGSVFTGRARTRAFAAVGTMIGAGLALGPGLAGLIVGHLGWRALFFLLVAVSAALIAATAAMPESRGEQTRLDLPGALGYVAGLVLVMAGVLQATDHGWTDARVIAPGAAGIVLLTVFIRRQRHVSDPLLDISLLTDRHIAGWLLAAVTLAIGTLGALTQLPNFLQSTGRFSPEAAGAIMLTLTLPILALPPLAAALVAKGSPPRAIMIAAVVLIVSGNLMLSRIQPDTGTGLVAASLLLVGAANGILTGLIDPQTLSAVPPHRLGMASGMLNTTRAAGNTVTLALFAALLATQLHSRIGDRSLAARIAAGDVTDPSQITSYGDALQTTLLIVATACAVLGTTAALLTRPHRTLESTSERTTMSIGNPAETAVLHYTVKLEQLDEHLQLLTDVYVELETVRPSAFSWTTYQIPGSRDFIEVASGYQLPGPLPDLPSFRRYRAHLEDRCETRTFNNVTAVGSFAST